MGAASWTSMVLVVQLGLALRLGVSGNVVIWGLYKHKDYGILGSTFWSKSGQVQAVEDGPKPPALL